MGLAIGLTALILSTINLIVGLYCLVRILTPQAPPPKVEEIPITPPYRNKPVEELSDIPDDDDEEPGFAMNGYGL